MKFKYSPFKNFPDPDADYGKMPLLPVTLKYAKRRVDLRCLVDSGAGDCLFSTDIAHILGIDLTKTDKRLYEGIGGFTMRGFVHPVMLNIKGFEEWIKIDAGFIEENEIPLLGQSGFFESYEVIFRGYQSRFEIKKSAWLSNKNCLR